MKLPRMLKLQHMSEPGYLLTFPNGPMNGYGFLLKRLALWCGSTGMIIVPKIWSALPLVGFEALGSYPECTCQLLCQIFANMTDNQQINATLLSRHRTRRFNRTENATVAWIPACTKTMALDATVSPVDQWIAVLSSDDMLA